MSNKMGEGSNSGGIEIGKAKQDRYDSKLSEKNIKKLDELAAKILHGATDKEKLEYEKLRDRLGLQEKSAQDIAEFTKKKTEELEELKTQNENKRAATIKTAALTLIKDTRTEIEKGMETLLGYRESMAYSLNGTAVSISGMVSNINAALFGKNVVKQEDLYKQLNDLITSGIIYNVEQRAYLATLAEDLGMAFDADSKALTRLINIYRQDISSERMAIEASLKTFLNQNYQTSQYIKEGFYEVSEALLESQSLMTSTQALAYEASIQKWMGSLSSVGMSADTINSLAKAIDAAASGNVSQLSGGIANLLYMGAARSDVDIANMLNTGLDSASVEALMSGIVSYIAQMGSNESNVVKASLASAFGINVSDIVAATKLKDTTATSNLSTNVESTLLDKVVTSNYTGYITVANLVENMLENLTFGSAASVALEDSGYLYTAYKALTTIGDTAADLLKGTKLTVSPLGIGMTKDLGELAQYAVDAGAVALAGGSGLVSLISGWASKNGTAEGGIASKVFQLLGSNSKSTQQLLGQAYGSVGSLSTLLKSAEVQKSGSAYSITDASDMVSTIKTSAKEESKKEVEADADTSSDVSLNDIYDAITDISSTLNTNHSNLSSITFRTKSENPVATATYADSSGLTIGNIDSNIAEILTVVRTISNNVGKDNSSSRESDAGESGISYATDSFSSGL